VQTRHMLSQGLTCIILFFVLAIAKGVLDVNFIMSLTEDGKNGPLSQEGLGYRGARLLSHKNPTHESVMEQQQSQEMHGGHQGHRSHPPPPSQSNEEYYAYFDLTDIDTLISIIALCIVITGGVCLGIFSCYMKLHKAVQTYEKITEPQAEEASYVPIREEQEPRIENHVQHQPPRFVHVPTNPRQQNIFSPIAQRQVIYQPNVEQYSIPQQQVYPQFVQQVPQFVQQATPQYLQQRAPVQQQWRAEPRQEIETPKREEEQKVEEVKGEEKTEQSSASNFPFIQMGFQQQTEQLRSLQPVMHTTQRQGVQYQSQFVQPQGYYYVRR